MINTEAQAVQVILYEGEGASPLEDEARFSIISGLLERGYKLLRVINRGLKPATHEAGDRMLVIGSFTNGAPSIEDAKGDTELEARDIRDMDAEAVFGLVESFRNGKAMNQPPIAARDSGEKSWKPWFPVIDYDRCTNCMQCLSFCLFDVYSIDDNQQISVNNQDNCKTNCPACSRVCPEVAIMFPKYSSGPINGEPVSDKDVQREKMKVDISSLLGGDIYATLRDRNAKAKSRFSRERSSDKALNERTKCLKKLQTDGLIPAEVLADIDLSTLPSPEEIQLKAKVAAEAAEAARK